MPPLPASEGHVIIHDARGGVIAEVRENRLLAAVAEQGACAALLHQLGAFVPQGAPLYRVWNAADCDRLARELRACTVIANERTPEQDPMFGFRQLVDVAERALSPGVNDPTTAAQALDQLHDLLRTLVARRFPSPTRVDEQGTLRLILPRPSWDAYVELAFDEIFLYGRGSLQVIRRMRQAVTDLLTAAPPRRRSALEQRLATLDACERSLRRAVVPAAR